jgi:hypothetical protein
MKTPALFKEYIWLVNTIYKARSITFEEINRKWMATDMSEGVEMARSTFNRHKDAIEDIFGIIIDCNRLDGYRYSIGNEEVLQQDTIQNWMLSTLSVNNIISESLSVYDRILLESIPTEGENLRLMLDAIKRNVVVTIQYKKYSSSAPYELVLEPYCVKLFHRRWYLLGRFQDSRKFRTLSFDRMESITISDTRFELDPTFNAEQFFSECFGIVQGDGTKLERVVLRAFGTERNYLQDLPIHHSQNEIITCDDYSDFEYYLRPTLDFSGYILSRGDRIKIIQPAWLAEEVKKMHSDSIKLYEGDVKRS